jgi:hypothetical protein
MSAWQRTLDELKHEAKNRTFEEPEIGPDTVELTDKIHQSKSGEEARSHVRTAMIDRISSGRGPAPGKTHGAERNVRGWMFFMSRFKNVEADSYFWHLSVTLFPRGRGSTDADWKFLGQAVAYLGGPPQPLLGMPEDPNAPIHWSWSTDYDNRNDPPRGGQAA